MNHCATSMLLVGDRPEDVLLSDAVVDVPELAAAGVVVDVTELAAGDVVADVPALLVATA